MALKIESTGLTINSEIRKSTDEKYLIIDELTRMSVSNVEFYSHDQSSVGMKLHGIFTKTIETLEKSVPVIKEIESFAASYDFDEKTPGNGYRSFVYIFEAAVKHTEKICFYITENRGNLLFRKNAYMKEIDACSQIFESLLQICEHLITMHKNSSDGNLYSKEYSHDNLITKNAKVINQACFHGRAIGFQYCDSLKPILRFLAVSMASFSESYFSTSSTIIKSTNSLFTSSKYFLDPELCAQRIINVSRNAPIDFCKSYWFLAEGKLMHTLPSIVGYKVEVNKVFKIPPEPLKIYSEKFDKMVDVPLPRSHTGLGAVSCRLLSARRRKGMVGEKSSSSSSLEPSKYLIFHCHGGGWVAQSSKSHELYLREWAVKMDVPILSIDYSLTPEAPFPRAFEDIFYTYCWILKNIEIVGSTGENIVFVGDSAGGNLNTACVLKCIEMGIKKPKGLFNAYTPFLVNFASTPARFLSLVDPLLPYGFIMRVFKGYGAVDLDSDAVSDSINPTSICTESAEDQETKELIKDVRDDNQNSGDLMLSPDTNKNLEFTWLKIKHNAAEGDWQTNLSSIRETPSEEPASPFNFAGDPLKLNGTVTPKSNLGSRTASEENIVLDVGKDALNMQSFQERVTQATSSFVNTITTPFKSKTFDENRGNSIPIAPDDEFIFKVPKNQYLSPYWASDEVLQQFPSTNILTTVVDPCLDDCVEFSKKLKHLNVDIRMDIVDGLVHGFLNFTQVSKESHDASMLCMKRIAELLDLTL